MKRLMTILVCLGAGVALGSGAWAWWTYREDQKELERLTLASQVLIGVYSQSRIQTADAFYQFIFPFDFLPYEGKAWQDLKLQAQLRRPIPPQDWESLELVRLARKIGFDPDLGRYGFVVLNMRIRAGINLEQDPMEVSVDQGERGRVLVLSLPSPTVTDVVVSDSPESGKLPAPVLSPQDWKTLVSRLKPKILSRVLEDGLLDQGKASGEKIFDRILKSSGLPGYEIIWRSPRTALDGPEGQEK